MINTNISLNKLVMLSLISTSIIGCAPTTTLKRSAQTANLCFVDNEKADTISRSVMRSAIKDAVKHHPQLKLHESCDTSYSYPTYYYRPIELRNPRTASYVTSSIITIAGIGLTVGLLNYDIFFFPIIATPKSSFAYEKWTDSSWAKTSYSMGNTEYNSIFGGKESRTNSIINLTRSAILADFKDSLR